MVVQSATTTAIGAYDWGGGPEHLRVKVEVLFNVSPQPTRDRPGSCASTRNPFPSVLGLGIFPWVAPRPLHKGRRRKSCAMLRFDEAIGLTGEVASGLATRSIETEECTETFVHLVSRKWPGQGPSARILRDASGNVCAPGVRHMSRNPFIQIASRAMRPPSESFLTRARCKALDEWCRILIPSQFSCARNCYTPNVPGFCGKKRYRPASAKNSGPITATIPSHRA
jgi:hypothetical protein